MPVRLALVLALLVTAVPGAASARSGSVATAPVVIQFRTPTGNIGCGFSSGLTGAEKPTIRCDIRSRLRPEPQRPKTCPLDYGDSIAISRLGRAILVCHGDTAIDPRSRMLQYGHTFRRAGLSCTSRFDGLTCTNRSGHGFFLSRQSWRIF
jgi:hypothetical protein